MTFTPPPPPRSTPPHWSHWIPVTPPPPTPPPPPIPFLKPMTPSPASLSPSLQWLLPSLLPLPPRFRSAPAPVSNLFPSTPTIFGGTRVPPRRSVPSQRARIGRVATNCPTVFCLWRTDVLTLTVPASLIAPARGRYFHFPSLPLCGTLPVSLLATLPWKASRAASIFPVITQDSAPKRRTCCVTAM